MSAATTTISVADVGSCVEDNALRVEYNQIIPDANIVMINCDERQKTLDKIANENKAFAAYGKALSDLAQDQYVTTTSDGTKISGTLTTLGVADPVTAAVTTIFQSVEKWALAGYRQKKIRVALTGKAAGAFQTVTADMNALADNYKGAIDGEIQDLNLIKNRVTHGDIRVKEPIASREMEVRLDALIASQTSKKAALLKYSVAVNGLPKAFDTAVLSTKKPNNSAIIQSVKDFITDANDAQSAIVKAIG